MLEIIKTDNGEIKAVCEWNIVNWNGQLDDKGTLIWIEELVIAKSYKRDGCIKHFIKKIIELVPYAEAGYFKRQKYNNRVKLYTRKQWEKLIKEV